jgi:hypothetical protein
MVMDEDQHRDDEHLKRLKRARIIYRISIMTYEQLEHVDAVTENMVPDNEGSRMGHDCEI